MYLSFWSVAQQRNAFNRLDGIEQVSNLLYIIVSEFKESGGNSDRKQSPNNEEQRDELKAIQLLLQQ